MTDQERQLLQELGDRVQKAPAPQVDRDADDLIRKTIGSRPDALYILTQTVLIQELALNQAKQQIDDLKRQQPPTSFLGNSAPQSGSGNRDAAADSRPQQPSGYRASSYRTDYVPPASAPQSATPPPLPQHSIAPPQYGSPQYGSPQYGSPQPSAFSGFLQNAAQTAAGVVAGEVAFSAISSLFGHHGGYYGGSGFLGGGGFMGGGGSVISPVSETIINNNYYDENRGREHPGAMKILTAWTASRPTTMPAITRATTLRTMRQKIRRTTRRMTRRTISPTTLQTVRTIQMTVRHMMMDRTPSTYDQTRLTAFALLASIASGASQSRLAPCH